MRFTLEIQCDNAAFDGDAASEVERILRNLTVREGVAVGDEEGTIRDSNGNTVGGWTLR